MKSHSVILLSIAIAVSTNALSQSVSVTTPADKGLSGKVKKITQVHYSVYTNELAIEQFDTGAIEETTYNPKGQITTERIKWSKDREKERPNFPGRYTYDDNGNLIKYTGYMSFGGTIYFKYDANNRLIKEVRKKADGSTHSVEQFIYVNGQLVRSKDTYSDKTMPSRTTRYDHRGNVTEHVWLTKTENADVVLTAKHDFTYDRNNKLLEEVICNYVAGSEQRSVYKYDRNGNLLEEQVYDKSNTPTNRYKNKYDERNNQIERREYDEDGKLTSKHAYRYLYDEKDRLIEVRETSKNPYHTTEITEKYDNWDRHGNYLTKTTTIADETKTQVSVIRRAISYYN